MKIFSFGYRCSSAGILKYLNVKHESFPFDWIISRLPIIKDCIDTDFIHFLNQQNYKKIQTQTIHYSNSPFYNILICNEDILYNTYYQNKFNKDDLFIPSQLQAPRDTYAYHLAINHRNILCDNDYEYYKRTVERFKNMICSNEAKMYLYIHPVISIEEYVTNKKKIINEYISFQTYMSSLNKLTSIYGVFIIMVKTNYDDVFSILPNIIENVEINRELGYSIHVVYTSKEFMDGGEIFMQNKNELETNELVNLVKSYIVQ
jgi:hypothetical protein